MAFSEYFTLLSILPAFDLDLTMLETNYFAAQRRFHPDRFVGKPEAERIAALEQSTSVNQGYETLKDPYKRAQYLLLLQGIFVGTEKDNVKPSHELLTEVMEFRESMEAAKAATELYALADELEEMHQRLQRLISVAYGKAQWDKMAQLVLKLGYVQKIQQDLTLRMKK
jgi:molecular chaperone HscB